MRRVVIAILLLFVLLLSSTTVAEASPSELPADVLSRLKVSYDKFNEGGYVIPNRDYGFYSYERPYLRPGILYSATHKMLVIQATYVADSWIFFDHVVFLVNGNRYASAVYGTFEDNVRQEMLGNGDVSEIIVFLASEQAIRDVFYAITEAGPNDEIEYRFYGDKGSPYSFVTETELQAWKDVLLYFNAMDQIPDF